MIYASDLDRTLIFSKRFIENNPTDTKLVCVEKSKSESYMATSVLESLKRINDSEHTHFVPVTARSLREYKRISLSGILPEYAITSNGGIILHNGIEVDKWKEYIESHINQIELRTLAYKVGKLKNIYREPKIIDNVYITIRTHDYEKLKVELDELMVKYKDYKILVGGDKVSIIPNILGKDKALRWLKDNLGESEIIASGDSDFDVPMLNIADIAIIPSHRSIRDTRNITTSFIEVTGGVESPLKTVKIVEENMGGHYGFSKGQLRKDEPAKLCDRHQR